MFFVMYCDVLHRPLILIISRCSFEEEGRHRNVATCKTHVSSVQSYCFVVFSLPSSLLSSLFFFSLIQLISVFLSSTWHWFFQYDAKANVQLQSRWTPMEIALYSNGCVYFSLQYLKSPQIQTICFTFTVCLSDYLFRHKWFWRLWFSPHFFVVGTH